MNNKKQFSIEILNSFANIIISDVANKYLKKLKKDKKNPHKLIENYLDKAVFLSQEDIKIWVVQDRISVMKDEIKSEFDQIVKQEKEYEDLVKELNFAFNLIKYEEVQIKVLKSIYDDFIRFNVEENKLKNDFKFEERSNNFNSVIRKVNRKKLTSSLSYF